MRRVGLALLLLSNLAVAPRLSLGDDLPRENAVVRVVKKTRGAVVSLRSQKATPARVDADSAGRVHNLGTGIIIDPRGYVVTNYHVVDRVNQIDAKTADGTEIVARLVNFDSKNDLALLKLESNRKTFPYISLWGAGDAIVGETVVAIGNPYGLSDSVTPGIVSAIHREMKLPNGESFADLIQVSATINPGNSGGPLFNINGQLLGINAAIRSNAQGIAFAIPTHTVAEVVAKVMGEPPLSMDKLGLRLAEEKDAGEAPSDSSNESMIVKVSHVEPNSPAAKLGFLPGDVVKNVDEQKVGTELDVHRVLWERCYGDQLSVKIHRAGVLTDLNFALKLEPTANLTSTEIVWQKLGLWGSPVAAERVKSVQRELEGGYLIRAVAPGSAAAQAGLKPGDILIGIHGYSTGEAANFRYMLAYPEFPKNTPVDCTFIRDGEVAPTSKIQLPTYP